MLEDWQEKSDGYGLATLVEEEEVEGSYQFILGCAVCYFLVEEVLKWVAVDLFVFLGERLYEVHLYFFD